MESLIVRFVLCTGEQVDIPDDPEPDGDEERLLRAIFGSDDDPSIFSDLENYLLSNVLGINMMRNNLSSGELPVQFREFKIFPPQVVEEALGDYSQNQVPGEYTDRESHLYAWGDWGSFICYILYEIELMIAKEKGFTETDFSAMLSNADFRYGQLADQLLEHYPQNIGNLTVCPSLWDCK